MTAKLEQSVANDEIRRPQLSREGMDRGMFRRGDEQNVGTVERIVGGVVGAGLLRASLRRKSLLGKLLFAGLGGAVLQRSITGHCTCYQALRISTAQQHPARAEDYFQRGIHVEATTEIAIPVDKLYAFWRDVSNLPRIMRHLRKVERLTDTRSRWTAAGPMRRTVTWDAEVIHDIPNELISWRSVGDSDVENAGTVIFTPRKNGPTEIKVVLDYLPPAGKLGKALAMIFGEAPEQSIREDLRRFKTIMETAHTLERIGAAGKPVG